MLSLATLLRHRLCHRLRHRLRHRLAWAAVITVSGLGCQGDDDAGATETTTDANASDATTTGSTATSEPTTTAPATTAPATTDPTTTDPTTTDPTTTDPTTTAPTTTGPTGPGSDSDSDPSTTGDPDPGAWQRDFGGGQATCGASDERAFAGLPHLTFGEATIYVGYDQVSGNNQDPLVARFDGGERTWCRYHEDDPPDGRALGLTWDGGPEAYVVYSIVGGGSDLEGKGGWLQSYAPGAISGGGPKVSVVGRVDTATGDLLSATFIIAVKSDNKVNTHNAADAVLVRPDGDVEFYGASAHKPIDADGKNAMDCTDYPFDSRYRLSPDLATLTCADCTNCASQKPCD